MSDDELRSVTRDDIVHELSREFVESTNVYDFMETYDIDDYDELIARTTGDVEGVEASGVDWFWDAVVDYLDIEFYREYETVRDDSDGVAFTEWYPGGTINIAHNVLDRYAADGSETRDSVACIWEGEDGEVREITYHELARQANRVANELEAHDVDVGDTVGLYMPMVPEVISILYGCFKAGAIAVRIFSGFGVDATATRIADSECTVLFTADGFRRRGEPVSLKPAATRRSSRSARSNTRSSTTGSARARLNERAASRFRGTTTPITGGTTASRRVRTSTTRGNSMRIGSRCCCTRRERPGGRRESSTPTPARSSRRRRRSTSDSISNPGIGSAGFRISAG